MEKKAHPSFGGSTPKGKGGSRPLDGPGIGRAPGGSDKTGIGKSGGTSHAFGKATKTMGGKEGGKCKEPGVKCYAQGPQGSQGGGY